MSGAPIAPDSINAVGVAENVTHCLLETLEKIASGEEEAAEAAIKG